MSAQKYIKNEQSSPDTYLGKIISSGAYYLIPPEDEVAFANNPKVLQHIAESKLVVAKSPDELNDLDNIADGINFLKNLNPQQVKVISQAESEPFAKPSFRTKRGATASKIVCSVSGSVAIDYDLQEERYVVGGGILVVNPEPGDFFTAEVMDNIGSIPDAPLNGVSGVTYREALCEDWPIVARYVEKEWIPAISDKVYHEINTYPLNAKITANLDLRVTYHATNKGVDRDIYVNYNLSKRLEE